MKTINFKGQELSISHEDEFILMDNFVFEKASELIDVDADIQRRLQWGVDKGHPLMFPLEVKCRQHYARMRGVDNTDPYGVIKILDEGGVITTEMAALLNNGKLEKLGGKAAILGKSDYVKALVAQTSYKNGEQARLEVDIEEANRRIGEQVVYAAALQSEKDEADLAVAIAAGEASAAKGQAAIALTTLKTTQAQNALAKVQAKIDGSLGAVQAAAALTKANSDLTTANAAAAAMKTKLLNL